MLPAASWTLSPADHWNRPGKPTGCMRGGREPSMAACSTHQPNCPETKTRSNRTARAHRRNPHCHEEDANQQEHHAHDAHQRDISDVPCKGGEWKIATHRSGFDRFLSCPLQPAWYRKRHYAQHQQCEPDDQEPDWVRFDHFCIGIHRLTATFRAKRMWNVTQSQRPAKRARVCGGGVSPLASSLIFAISVGVTGPCLSTARGGGAAHCDRVVMGPPHGLNQRSRASPKGDATRDPRVSGTPAVRPA